MKHLKNWILAALLGVNIAGNVSAQTSQREPSISVMTIQMTRKTTGNSGKTG